MEYTRPFQILCEGDGDEAFLKALRAQYNLPDFQCTCVAQNKAFLGKLKAFEPLIDRGVIRKILLVADTDDDPKKSFARIQKDIEKVGFLPKVAAPLETGGSTKAAAAVVMVPGIKEPGNLETLFLKAVKNKRPELLKCAEAFSTCQLNGAADTWKKGERDKMLLRSVIAASIQDNPNSSLNYIWTKPDVPMNIDDAEFKFISDFMQKFFV